jgi:hypothetical protein
MNFTATRASGDSTAFPLTISFTVGGTATYNVDYTVSGAASFSTTVGSVTIGIGQTSATMVMTPVPDSTPEADETIILTPIASPGVFVIGSGSNWTGTITNDDTDASFSSVVLLLQPVGADNSTAFVDLSSYARTITTIGDTKILGNRASFDGSGDNLSAASSTALAMDSGDFTIELIFTTSQTSSYPAFLSRRDSSFGSGSWAFYASDGTGKINIFWADFSGSAPILAASAATNDGTQHHVAWVRSGTTHTLFVDGVSVATATSSASMPDISFPLIIGGEASTARDYAGTIKGLRITKGVARYSASFTPPSLFPTS